MEGVLDMELPSGGWTRASYSKGLKHGLERKFDGPYPKVQCLQRIAFYDNDSIIQVVECLMGGAYLIGRADPEMEKINDKDAIYVYPDLHTAIHGRYVDDQLISGEMCSIEDVEINPETFMLSLKGRNMGQPIKLTRKYFSVPGKKTHEIKLNQFFVKLHFWQF